MKLDKIKFLSRLSWKTHNYRSEDFELCLMFRSLQKKYLCTQKTEKGKKSKGAGFESSPYKNFGTTQQNAPYFVLFLFLFFIY